jgi:anti-anti-sigma regulatory factor
MARSARRPRDATADAPVPHRLAADLRICACPAERDALLVALGRDGPIVLDGSAVTRIDATGLQLLAALFRDRRARGAAVSWSAASEALRTAASLCGLAELLSL